MEEVKIPCHIGIIMDGNGTWATEKNIPRAKGHKAGVNALRKTVESCKNIGIKHLTVFAFSTENWNRSQEEVSTLMNMIREYFQGEDIQKLKKEKVRIRVLGNKIDGKIPSDILELIDSVERDTKNNNSFYFNIAFNYGGRDEILEAIKKIPSEKIESLTEEELSSYLYTEDSPSPDLIIRTGKQKRISNFLLWQSAYSEYIFCDLNWPDFDENKLKECLEEYSTRVRKFGKA